MMSAPRTLHLSLILLVAAFFPPLPCFAQADKAEEILAFANPWILAQDYAWTRESLSRLESDKKPGLRIKDNGRLRVEFIKFEDEAVVLDIHVLQYRFETQIKNDPVKQGVSALEGQRLPETWLHWALGFSVNLPSGHNLERADDQQAGQIYDLVDFRGFVPDKIPKPGMEWPLVVSPDRGEAYAFKEELKRTFRCDAAEAGDKKTKCKVHFTELLKVTPQVKSRTWEMVEREGDSWMTLPDGLIEAAEWKATSTEAVPGPEKGGKVITETTVTLTRVDTPPPRPRKSTPPKKEKEKESKKAEPKAKPDHLPVPPR
jgi:hypothetical protein